MTVRSPRSLDEALRTLESLARNALAGSRLDDAELANVLDTLHGRAPSAQFHKLITVLRTAPARFESTIDARRRFFHATRAIATGFRAPAA